MEKYAVLICDDNNVMCEGLSTYLNDEGMETFIAETGERAIEILRSNHIDVLLLDIMLPGIDGYEVCKRIRKFSDVYIIMISARSQEIDRVYGIENGADDYIVKPFSTREVVAKIWRAMERIHPKEIKKSENKITLAELSIFPDTYRVFIGNEEIHLSSKEFSLLLYFVNNSEKVLTREHILDNVWNFEYYGDTRIIDGMVKRLRKKITRDGVHFSIQTVYGVGYRMSTDNS